MDNLTPSDLENISKPEQPEGHFDPTDELSSEELAECSKRVEEHLSATNCMELNLAKSEIKVPGQEWALVSFIGEDLGQTSKDLGMKIWGTFSEIKDAKDHAEKINKDVHEKNFDIYILEMYTWAMIPPKKEYIDDQNYHEEKLHEIITERKRQQDLAKEIFDTRKEKLIANPDKNEFNKNKEKLKELMDSGSSSTDVGGEIHKKIFGEPKELPKMEVRDKDDNILSTSQGISESNEDFKRRQDQSIKIVEEVESDHAEKFYNK